MLKIALVTNEPPPYRVPIFNRLAAMPDIQLDVIFFTKREPNRHWNLPPMEFRHHYLRERFITIRGRYIHNNPDIFGVLKHLAPQVIVSDGLNPSNLYAFAYALTHGIPHVPLTDGTDISEAGLSRVHKFIRTMVYRRSKAFLYASSGGLRLYQSYGVHENNCFRSHLCVDNEAYHRPSLADDRRFDFIFCGRMVKEKNPLFALQVAEFTARTLGRKTSILYVGSGPEDEAIRNAAQESDCVHAYFHGFAAQEELPALYRSAKVFLFPTMGDVWGIVANEACAAGLPIIVSPHAGANGELIIDGRNGFIRPLQAQAWADHAASLLNDPVLWGRFSACSSELVKDYNFNSAAEGIVAACHHAASPRKRFSSNFRRHSRDARSV